MEQWNNGSHQINAKLAELRDSINYLSNGCDCFQNEVEQFQLIDQNYFYNNNNNNNNNSGDYGDNNNMAIRQEFERITRFDNIEQRGNELINNIKNHTIEMRTTFEIINVNQLAVWKQGQARAKNGAQLPLITLDEIQNWFEQLANFIISTRCIIQKLCTIVGNYQLTMFGDHLHETNNVNIQLLSNLIVSAFVVEEQPPQVMKTQTRFTATLRFLLTNLNVMEAPEMIVSILSEGQAKTQHKNKILIKESAGDISYNKEKLEVQANHLRCHFKNMQLKKIKRTEKKTSESVMDEKFTLRFSTTIDYGDFRVNVWVMSLPVVVIVHGNQEPQSWATITWDNAFSLYNRIPFFVPDDVSWYEMAHMLNTKFTSKTGHELSNNHLQYLCDKIFRASPYFDASNKSISWTQFCKAPLPPLQKETFWDWFYSIMKLTQHHLSDLWKGGFIIGFYDKRQAEVLLQKCVPGTFLLRFSESMLGGISIVYKHENGINMLTPFTQKDFAIRSLSDRIKDLNECVTLYPNLAKDAAFGSYYTPMTEEQNRTSNGYVKPILKTIVPDSTTCDLNASQYMNLDIQLDDIKMDTLSSIDLPADFLNSNEYQQK